MAMKVTKRAELIARMKREESEKRAERDFAEFLENDTLESCAADLFDIAKTLVRVSLKNVEFRADISTDAYDGLEGMRVRLARHGIAVEWRDILPDEFKGLYGLEEKC
jgi:hypothetical protein